MVKTLEVITKLCSQVMRYLLSKSAEKVSFSCEKEGQHRYLLKIQARINLSESDLTTLRFYLSLERHEELAYYFLPLVGELGSDEEMLLISTLVDDVSLAYDKESGTLDLKMLIQRRKE